MTTEQHNGFVTVTASEGMMLTDGITVTQEVSCPDAATAANWREVTETEAAEIETPTDTEQ